MTWLAPAEAASTRYKVSATVTAKAIDRSSATPSLRRTTIKGRVTGGPVSGKKVYFYGINTDTRAKTKVYLGADRLSSSGRFAKSFTPKDAGRWSIIVRKKAGSGKKEGTDLTRVDAFEFANLVRFLNRGASTGTSPSLASEERVGTMGGSTQLAVEGGGVAVFDTQGFRCKKIVFKTGVSDASPVEVGTFRAYQSSTIISRTMARDDAALDLIRPEYKPTRDLMKPYSAFRFAVTPTPADNDPAVRFLLINPKVFCTYPLRSTPR